ncbi:MAG TPA: hypothetical protein VNI60_11560 [Pyrinomonadaceae bacterium]|nr:hypothetical protein [Pyrinomonadaceae bacterium]
MKSKFMQMIGRTFLALLMLFGFTQISVSGQERETGNSPEEQIEHARPSIKGAWRTAVTQHNCQTGLPLAPASRGLLTFNEGGTLAEYNSPGQNPALRSPGHGVWEQHRSKRNFSFGGRNYSFVFMINRYDASGVFISSQKVRAALRLSASGNSFTTNAAVEIFDANDNLIGTGCATAVGTRIE